MSSSYFTFLNFNNNIRINILITIQYRDLARNEEFSEIAVINIFFTVLKTKTQLSVGGGGPAGKISR